MISANTSSLLAFTFALSRILCGFLSNFRKSAQPAPTDNDAGISIIIKRAAPALLLFCRRTMKTLIRHPSDPHGVGFLVSGCQRQQQQQQATRAVNDTARTTLSMMLLNELCSVIRVTAILVSLEPRKLSSRSAVGEHISWERALLSQPLTSYGWLVQCAEFSLELLQVLRV